MYRRLTAAMVLGGTVLGSASLASAQSTTYNRNIDVQAFRPAPGPYNFLTVEGARVDGDFGFSIGAFANYSYRSFTIYNAVDCPHQTDDTGCHVGDVRSTPVAHLATLDVLASITLFRRLQIGLDIPLSVVSGDNIDPMTALPLPSSGSTTSTVTQAGIGDPRLEAKVRIVGNGLQGPGFAISVFGQFPIGQLVTPSSYLGDSSVDVGGRLIGDFRHGPWSVAANAGAYFRAASEQIYSSYATSRIFWGAAGGYDITPRITAMLEVFGSNDLSHGEALQNNPMEGDLAGRYRLGDLALTAGAGTGILRGLGAPVVRGFLGVMYAPYRVDSDHDGITDDRDRCPTEPEDRDGFEDNDGCPDPDNDGDGIPDVRDRCPDQPEDRDGFQDTDGCPDPDNDHDGIPDGYDTCPNEAEDRDGDRDEDGCPDNDRDRDGVPDDRDHCPTQPEDTDGFQDEDGCPDPDNDGDGIPDTSDQCSDQPETFNGYQDDDGCPDQIPDRDHDGIPDDRDRCPDQPETYNGIQDEDGCPEHGAPLVELQGDQIRIMQAVNFATNSDRIVGARSFSVLDAVVAILHAHPELAHVEVQGHTDNVGDAEHNRDLSRRRAESVRTYLVAHATEASRITSQGFGPDRPIESNSTRNGRAHNRRVEFHIVGPSGAEAGTGAAVHEGAAATPAAGGATSAPAAGAPAAGGAHPVSGPTTTVTTTSAPAAGATTTTTTTAPAAGGADAGAPAAHPAGHPAAPATGHGAGHTATPHADMTF